MAKYTAAKKPKQSNAPRVKRAITKKRQKAGAQRRTKVANSKRKAKPKPPPSPHTWEGSYLSDEHDPGCVNRHVSYYAPGNACSHRAQAKLQADAEDKKSQKYTWPKDAHKQPDTPKDWDISTPGNFEYDSRVPFWHEAHHIVANAELKVAILEAGEGISPKAQVPLMIRSGLLREQYNLNSQVNMIILPMVRYAARALGLPLHRRTPAHWHHARYSDYIRQKLTTIFSWVKEAADGHKVPDYQKTRKKIELLSKTTYPNLLKAGELMKTGGMAGDALEDISHDFLENGPPVKKGSRSGGRP